MPRHAAENTPVEPDLARTSEGNVVTTTPVSSTPVLTVPRVLSIAGTDPTGGAGHAADLKSIAAMGGYGLRVVTAVVAQNTQGVRRVHTPPVDVLRAQGLERGGEPVGLVVRRHHDAEPRSVRCAVAHGRDQRPSPHRRGRRRRMRRGSRVRHLGAVADDRS